MHGSCIDFFNNIQTKRFKFVRHPKSVRRGTSDLSWAYSWEEGPTGLAKVYYMVTLQSSYCVIDERSSFNGGHAGLYLSIYSFIDHSYIMCIYLVNKYHTISMSSSGCNTSISGIHQDSPTTSARHASVSGKRRDQCIRRMDTFCKLRCWWRQCDLVQV